jgi:putative ABC transport system ATP-binding protein
VTTFERSNVPAFERLDHHLIRLEKVSRVYQVGSRTLTALRDVDLSIDAGEFVAIVGPSGSGKSTLLNVISGIDKPTSGRVFVGEVEVSRLDENSLARWRGATIGIVFQFFQLLPTLTALENVLLPMEFRGTFPGRRHERALAALATVGLADRADQLPSELSGGEQQRVAIARALANDPPILLADEPTGNLDSVNGQRVVELLAELHHAGKTIVLVTHGAYLTTVVSRVIQVQDGQITAESVQPGV